MDGFIKDIDQGAIKSFMDGLPPDERILGEPLFLNGKVDDPNIQANLHGYSIKTVVHDQIFYEVQIWCERNASFIAWCACNKKYKCEHIYATLRTTLVELTQRHVQQLSAGAIPGVATAFSQTGSSSDVQGFRSFREVVEGELSRKLKRDEHIFAMMIDETFKETRRSRKFEPGILYKLGLHFSYEAHQLMCDCSLQANTPAEFWLWFAAGMELSQLAVPVFLRPMADKKVIQERLRVWRRQNAIKDWEGKIQNANTFFAKLHRPVQQQLNLRFRARTGGLDIEFKDAASIDFTKLTQAQLRRMSTDIMEGLTVLPAKAQVIWELMSQAMSTGLYSPEIDLSRKRDGQNQRIAEFLFRQPDFNELLVNFYGKSFTRSSQPLVWKLSPSTNPEGDYHLLLMQADGQRPPLALFNLDGKPPLYVTNDTIYEAPEGLVVSGLDPNERLIPAPAMETEAGIHFLENHSIALPPQIQDRLLRLPVKITLQARLAKDPYRPTIEYCVVGVSAKSEDGQIQETWNGYDWRRKNNFGPRISSQSGSMIRYYDRSLQASMSALLRLLDLKFEHALQGFALKVTRKFPAQFSAWLASLPPQIELQLEGDLASLNEETLSGRVRLEATEFEIDWFDLKVVLDISDTTLTDKELKMLMDAKGQFVRLDGKGWRRLDFNISQEDDEQLAQLGLTPRELSSEPQRLHALQLATAAAKRFLPEEQAHKIQLRADEIKTRVTPPISEDLKAELRPYQIEGYHFLAYLSANRFGGILADDMGLGKTLQALAWMLWLRGQTQSNQQVLVVCPKSVMDNWRAEAERFASKLRVKVWAASELSQLPDSLDAADLHVINYSQLRMLSETLLPVPWLAVVLDEGQYIKNPNSQTAQAARLLKASHRLVLTGTPIENRLMDLWSLMAFAMPGALSSRHSFGRIYDSKVDPLARRRLSARVRPFLLRRTKAQVAQDLPEKIEEDLYCEIEGEQLTLYRAELKFAQQLLLNVKTQKELAQFQFNFLASMLRLRQICCHPALVKPHVKGESAKLNALVELLDPLIEEGHKVLVFSQFVMMLDRIRNVLENNDWPLFYLTGDTENRGQLVQDFQNAKGAAVFLISLKAGGFGLNLTAANYVVLFDPWWNPAVETQAIDRTHRIGQTNTVIAYRLLIKNSIEEKIRILQRQKAQMADDVLGEEKFAQNLTIEDLRYLFAE